MSIFEKIEALCKERGMTIRKLEELAGIGNGVLGRLKTSTKSPTLTTLEKISRFFEIDIKDLL